jgi:hypothetical protein
MANDTTPARTNYLRRIFGVLICFGPAILSVVSLVCGLLFWNGQYFGARFPNPESFIIASISAGLSKASAGLSLFIGVVNSSLSFARPWLYRQRHKSMEGYKKVSNVPLIGTILVVLALMFGFGSTVTSILCLLATALDTGGLPWFLIMTWRDRGLWDE